MRAERDSQVTMELGPNASPRPPVVAVLLATYNGGPWVAQQVADILDQSGVHVRLIVSDDMSSDGTWEWLLALAENDNRVELLSRGQRFGGAARNFFRLLRDARLQSVDYVALADQDDIWLPGKLARAIEMMNLHHCVAYSGNVTAFWPDGRRALIDKAQTQRQYDYLFEAAGPGCTYVLNHATVLAFREFLTSRWEDVNEVALHDWMIHAWARATGLPWFIDRQPMLEYRQHGSNQFGANQGMGAIRTRLRMLKSGWYRAEIRKIARLVTGDVHALPTMLSSTGKVPLMFLLRHGAQTRRRARDRLFFFVTVMLGIY